MTEYRHRKISLIVIKSISKLTLYLMLFGGLYCPAAISQVDPMVASQCKDARDFQGCVKAFTTPAQSTDGLSELRGAMKQVAARLSSGTSLRDSSATFQPVIDAHAVVPTTEQNTKAYKDASLAIRLFDLTKQNWSARIQMTRYYDTNPYMPGKACDLFAQQIRQFNSISGASLSFSYQKKGILGVCHRSSARPETLMYNHTIKVLREGAVDPKVIAAREAEKKRQQELCAMGPWNRYLAENPAMASWAKSNPQLAEAKKQKIINDPQNKRRC